MKKPPGGGGIHPGVGKVAGHRASHCRTPALRLKWVVCRHTTSRGSAKALLRRAAGRASGGRPLERGAGDGLKQRSKHACPSSTLSPATRPSGLPPSGKPAARASSRSGDRGESNPAIIPASAPQRPLQRSAGSPSSVNALLHPQRSFQAGMGRKGDAAHEQPIHEQLVYEHPFDAPQFGHR